MGTGVRPNAEWQSIHFAGSFSFAGHALFFVFVRPERRATSAHAQAEKQEPSREGAPRVRSSFGFPLPL